MGTFAKGDIVLFPFPYTDLSNRKLRPCLVLSEQMGEDMVLCQITSQKIQRDEYSVSVKKEETKDGSLQVDSYIRTNMLFTAATSQILKKCCSVSSANYNKVVEKIVMLISVNDQSGSHQCS